MRVMSLDGTFNTRAFGRAGEPWLIRSATLDNLTATGDRELHAHGVTLVLDLREPGERPTLSHSLPVRSIPLYRTPDAPPQRGTLEQVYETLIRERGPELAEAVATIAEAPGAVLVHCSAGKDRTGLVVALALLAAGVPEADVVDDYAASGADVAVHRATIVDAALARLALGPEERTEARRLHLDSPAEALVHALGVLEELGGAANYLVRNGLDDDQLASLRDKMRKAAA